MYYCALRVWLPDEPGALGSVASRIGIAGGDVLAIDVLERDRGRAIDEFLVSLKRAGDVELLRREVESVGGVSIEEIREIVSEAHESGLSGLEHVIGLLDTADSDAFVAAVLEDLVQRTHSAGGAVIDADGSIRASFGAAPDAVDDVAPTVCTASLDALDAFLVLARPGSPFRDREHRRVRAVAAMADAKLRWDHR